MSFGEFLRIFPPEGLCTHLDEKVIEKYKDIVPKELIDFWEENGTNKYGNGIIEIINPDEYRQTLEAWLGKEVPNYVPLAVSAFGNLYYYRKINDDTEDVCVIDPHYRSINACTWSLNEFFEDYLIDEDIIQTELCKELFEASVNKLGTLKLGEIFYFVPALCIGGAQELKYVDKGNAIVHLQLLLSMGL